MFAVASRRAVVRARGSLFFCTHPEAVYRIIAPTAILGYGFPEASFTAALAAGPIDLIAVDGGSIDPGPYYLATRSSFTAIAHVLRDLKIMLRGFIAERQRNPRCKLVIGSAGGCGSNNQVDLLAEQIPQLLQQLGGASGSTPPVLATVTSELLSPQQLLRDRQLTPLGPFPEGDVLEGDPVVVAQMGLEPIICALDRADIVLCGRAYDPAVFAADPVRLGFPAAAALHAAKVLECGAIASVPGSGSDCLVAELRMDNTATVFAPNPARTATALSVAAHTLYEKSHPHCFGLPSGVLDTSETRFLERPGGRVDIVGTRFFRTPPSVKLEGATVRGHRVVKLSTLPEESMSRAADAVSNGFVYGVNGVEPNQCDDGTELGIVLAVSGGEREQRAGHLALLRATLLHWGFEGRKATAGNLAFPFSPSDMSVIGHKQQVTVCGTRDPQFVLNHKQILTDVAAYVNTLAPSDGLEVKWDCFGLPGMPKLKVDEFVAATAEDACAIAGESQAPAEAIEEWLCSGGKAADYTMQHLIHLDQQLCRDLFKIELVATGELIEPRLVPWGEGPVISLSEATSGWASSNKPLSNPKIGTAPGTTALGQLARVVRSKNAGVNELTFDLFFDDFDSYNVAKVSSALDGANVEALLERPVLGVFCDDKSFAIKITCARGMLAGSIGERDVYGAQQHQRLLGVKL